jgi:hypothetical protein
MKKIEIEMTDNIEKGFLSSETFCCRLHQQITLQRFKKVFRSLLFASPAACDGNWG